MTLAEVLERHLATDALEAEHLDIIRRFVAGHENPFDRAHLDAHCTAAAYILSSEGDALLLVYHRKLHGWLPPGGHGEPGETTGDEVALREAREETGVSGLMLHAAAPRPFDVDVHRIPAFGDVPAHDHLDLRYLAVAPAGAEPNPDAAETGGARWFTLDEVEATFNDRPTRRVLGKICRLLRAG